MHHGVILHFAKLAAWLTVSVNHHSSAAGKKYKNVSKTLIHASWGYITFCKAGTRPVTVNHHSSAAGG